jgi:hypothetical protein
MLCVHGAEPEGGIMRIPGGWGPWITGAVVVFVAGGFVPAGLLAQHRGWFMGVVWVVYAAAAVAVVAVAVRLWRR